MLEPTLNDLRIAITRDERGNRDLEAELTRLRARVTVCPLIRIVPPTDPAPLRHALGNLKDYDWLVLTSVNAAHAVLEGTGGKLPDVRVACVGKATARALQEQELEVDLVPNRATVKGLLEALATHDLKDQRFLYPRSELAPDTLVAGLQALGASVDAPVAYGNLPNPDGMQALADTLAQGDLDIIVFASPSAVHNAFEACGDALARVRLYSIGPSTTLALREHGLEPVAEAVDHDLVRAILSREASLD
jgi:uroporphyrinogen-III synthase